MVSALRLLVVAITAVLIISMIWNFYPHFFHKNPVEEINRHLENSQDDLGMVTEPDELYYTAGTGISAKGFDTAYRTVAFKCNSIEACDSIGMETRTMGFKDNERFKTSTRCEYDAGIYICRVYVGAKPAQVEGDGTSFEGEKLVRSEDFDGYDIFAGEGFDVKYNIANSGELDAHELKGKVSLIADDAGEEFEVWSDVLEIGDLEAGGAVEKTQTVTMPDIEGRYKMKVRVDDDDAGFYELEETVRIFKECVADTCSNAERLFGQCITHCSCSECSFGFKCLNAILEESAENLELEEGMELVAENAEVIGSRFVDFEVDGEFCQ